jgi:hypothetical protein
MIGVPCHGDIDRRSVSLETMSGAPTSAARSRIRLSSWSGSRELSWARQQRCPRRCARPPLHLTCNLSQIVGREQRPWPWTHQRS